MTQPTDRITALYLELRRVTDPKNYRPTSKPATDAGWIWRTQAVLAISDGLMRTYTRSYAHTGSRHAWETNSYLHGYLRGAHAEHTEAALLATALGQRAIRHGESFAMYHQDRFDMTGTQLLRAVFDHLNKYATDSIWLPPVVVTLPGTNANLDKLTATPNVAPWPVLNRVKNQYAKQGIEI